ncbi:Solute carrier family 12 member 6 [Lamellibrachia satsuma]|nr:Solute carrier family 12 member 6 [Lamellibrachia satsuma]
MERWPAHSCLPLQLPNLGFLAVTDCNLFTPKVITKLRDGDNADISFVALTAIYFPSVTGIMTGSNMSGDLKDPQKSIPVGTILAQLTCTFVYLLLTTLYGATSNIRLLQDKYGNSLGGSLLAAKLGWPSQWVVLIGAFCSTLGAALQCLTSAPRLLQAIAKDNVIPFLDMFKVTTKHNEPHRALLITIVIAEGGILLANLDWVAPILDVFFLMCYGFVNLTCALQTLLQTPSWRPRFTYYHWSLSLLGVILNLGLSITAGWYYAITAFSIAAFIYKYVEYKGGEKEWGDGIRGLSMTTAHRALLKLDDADPHTKNWRPQILMLIKLKQDFEPIYPELFTFGSQLKAGKGLVIAAAAIEGDFISEVDKFHQARQKLLDLLDSADVEGFAKVVISNDVQQSLSGLVQTAGLGGMKPNTLLMAWPRSWDRNREGWINFVETLRIAATKDIAILVARGIGNFPSNEDRMTETIDVWWIVRILETGEQMDMFTEPQALTSGILVQQ